MVKYRVYKEHQDPETRHRLPVWGNEAQFLQFTARNRQQLCCTYCGKVFEIADYEDLAGATYVQMRLGFGMCGLSGPFCCPICREAITDKRIKYCLQCGKPIESGEFCDLKCSIAFCED